MTAMIKKKYYPQHMHIHSIYEPGASMEGHMYFASLLGMKYIWFTEHDILWEKKSFSFGFEPNETEPDEHGIPTQVFLPTCDSIGDIKIDMFKPYEGASSMRLTANENKSEIWQGAAAVSAGKTVCQSLCRTNGGSCP